MDTALRPVFFAHYVPGLPKLIPLMEVLGGVMWTDERGIARAMRQRAPHLACRRFRRSSSRYVSRCALDMEGDVFIGANSHPYFFNRVNGPRVQVFHGVSSKGFSAQWRNTRYFDLCLLAGERMRRDFERAGLLETVRCEVVGYIPSDHLVRGPHDVEGFRRAHDLDPSAPTVLYAPTWSGLSSFNDHGLEIVRAVPREWNLVVKLHPWTIRRREAPRMIPAVQEEIAGRPHAAMLPPDTEPTLAMVAADILVGDHSSVCEEFLLLDRAVVFFDHLHGRADLDRETRALIERGDWSDLHRCGPVVRSGEDLAEALSAMQRSPETFAEERHRMRDFVFHRPDGPVAERAAEAIRRIAEEMRGQVFGQRCFQ
ncbi:CDP-glycerol glycerophosphotransferase family protein [Candidatus Sumerlaeota bacterium]|nr:CDP-glycerol glycerophosphotransferase family protein [Candidatus Sumerlaeota bacterium]